MEKIFALIKNNVVINTVLFDENATQEFINEITVASSADIAIDTSSYNAYGIGYTWHGDHFRPVQPYPSWSWDGEKWIAPTPEPTDAVYDWDENSQSWVFVKDFTKPEEIASESEEL